MLKVEKPPEWWQRFVAKVEFGDGDGCWVWTAARHPRGYGHFNPDGVVRSAHRLAYEVWVGPIPEGLDLDHLCRNTSCVNPGHLEPVSRKENTMRGDTITAAHARRTHCPQGHPYDEENTYHIPSRPTARYCRICQAEHKKAYSQRLKLRAVLGI